MTRSLFRRLLPPGLALFLLPAALAQSPATAPEQDEARSMLERVAQTYTNLDRFFFEALEKTETVSQDFGRTTETRYITAMDADGRARFGMFSRGNEGLAVFDGSATWTYSPQLKQYTRRSEDPFALARGEQGPPKLDPRQSARRYTQRYAAAATRLREAQVVLGPDRPAGTQVTIEAIYDTPPGVAHGRLWRRYWIDRNVGLVLREVSIASMRKADMQKAVKVRQTIDFQTAVVGDAVPVATFTFEPPPGAELVEQFGATSGLVSMFEGQAAPDFACGISAARPIVWENWPGRSSCLTSGRLGASPAALTCPMSMRWPASLVIKAWSYWGSMPNPSGAPRPFSSSRATASRASSTAVRGFRNSTSWVRCRRW